MRSFVRTLKLISFFTVAFTLCRAIDQNAIVDQLQKNLDALQIPSPETVEDFVTQVKGTCHGNFTVDLENAMENMTSCISRLFNESDLMGEIRDAVPKGDLDLVFRNICVKWPQTKSCMLGGLDAIEECWGQNTRNQFLRAMDSVILFFCGINNDGEKAALFIAEDGLNCIEEFGEPIGNCLSEKLSVLKNGKSTNLCKIFDFLINCLSLMRKCSNITPENLLTSMVQELKRVMECEGQLGQEKQVGVDLEDWAFPSTSAVTVRSVTFRSILEQFLEDWVDISSLKPAINDFVTSSEPCQNLKFILPKFSGSELEFKNGATGFCANISHALDCISPHYELIKRYAPQGFVGVLMVQEFCSEGDQSVTDGFKTHDECKSYFEEFDQCLNEYNFNNGEVQFFSNNFCRKLSTYYHCLNTSAVGYQCKIFENIWQPFMSKVMAKDTQIVQPCLNTNISMLKVPKARNLLNNAAHNFMQFINLFLIYSFTYFFT